MIKINNITKKYGDNVILDHASYEFPQTGIVCLTGASGAGKTTLFHLLAGFDTHYEGEIWVGGTGIHAMDSDALCGYRRENIGFVFQNYHLLPGYTVLENVMLACAPVKPDSAGEPGFDEKPREGKGRRTEPDRRMAVTLLSRLGIAEKETQRVENLSGGQKQRVAIARALMGDPRIILADEPTGALDRGASDGIMELLREISEDRLVLVITHDRKICDFADEVVRIQDGKLTAERTAPRKEGEEKPLRKGSPVKAAAFARGAKNFRIHRKRFLAVSFAVSFGLLAFLYSLSFGNVTERSIQEFEAKNTAFNSGYIKGTDDGAVLEYLNRDDRVEHVFYQYKLEEIRLSANGKTEWMQEKFPAAGATQGLSYGVLPRRGKNEIALSPSLAKKFDSDIKNLLGKELRLEYGGRKHTLRISGIYNAGYDDFFVSSDVEQQLYADLPKQDNYSVRYDVKDFSDIVAVSNSLKLRGLNPEDASEEVYALQSTFDRLNKLFLAVSVLILAMGFLFCAVLLFKLHNTRCHEVGLLAALGFRRRQISSFFAAENLLLSVLAAAVNFILLGASVLLCRAFGLPFLVTGAQAGVSALSAFAAVLLLGRAAGRKVLRMDPAAALRG